MTAKELKRKYFAENSDDYSICTTDHSRDFADDEKMSSGKYDVFFVHTISKAILWTNLDFDNLPDAIIWR
jgi:hypothetical protein